MNLLREFESKTENQCLVCVLSHLCVIRYISVIKDININ